MFHGITVKGMWIAQVQSIYSFTQFTVTAKSRSMSDAVKSGRVKDEDHPVSCESK